MARLVEVTPSRSIGKGVEKNKGVRDSKDRLERQDLKIPVELASRKRRVGEGVWTASQDLSC